MYDVVSGSMQNAVLLNLSADLTCVVLGINANCVYSDIDKVMLNLCQYVDYAPYCTSKDSFIRLVGSIDFAYPHPLESVACR